jgi:hypothetical protein
VRTIRVGFVVWSLGTAQIVRMRALAATVAVSLIAGALVSAPSASASGHHIKLTGIVIATKRVKETHIPAAVITVKEGKKKVGSMLAWTLGGAGKDLPFDGTTNLKVGKVRDKATLHVLFTSTGSGCGFGSPSCKPAKFGTGTISNRKHGSENIRVNHQSIPLAKGKKFTFVLSY